MKKVGIKMSLMMGAAMSLCLSLAGNLSSGHFTFPGFLRSFAASFVVSLLVGFLLPMGKITRAVDRKLGLRPRTLPARDMDALVSSLLYTPIMTFVMVTLNHRLAVSHGAKIPYWPMLGRGLLIGIPLGFVLAFLLMPVFMRVAMKGTGERE